jgi:hypothetical protein
MVVTPVLAEAAAQQVKVWTLVLVATAAMATSES